MSSRRIRTYNSRTANSESGYLTMVKDFEHQFYDDVSRWLKREVAGEPFVIDVLEFQDHVGFATKVYCKDGRVFEYAGPLSALVRKVYNHA